MIHNFEQRPPQIQAIKFDGTNAAEVAEAAGVEVPEIEQDDSGTFIVLKIDRGWMGFMDTPVHESCWVVLGDLPYVLTEEEIREKYKDVS